MPEPDTTVGRTQLWRPARIMAWHASRPRPGVGGRPVDTSPAPTSQATRSDEPFPSGVDWQVHGRRSLFAAPAVRVDLADVELADGGHRERHLVWTPPGVTVLLLDEARGRVLLTWRRRFASGAECWELPRGSMTGEEEPADVAVRVVESELGIPVHGLAPLITFESANEAVDGQEHVFVGYVNQAPAPPPATTGVPSQEWFALDDIPRLISSELIRDAATLASILHVLAVGPSNAPPEALPVGDQEPQEGA